MSYTNLCFLDVFLSNITATEVDVTLVLYKGDDGTILQNGSNYSVTFTYATNAVMGSGTNDSFTATFTIEPYETVRCKVLKTSTAQSTGEYGYGIITYTQDDDYVTSVIAEGCETQYKYKATDTLNFSTRTLQINKGEPF